MKILILNSVYNFGSTGKIVKLLSDYLQVKNLKPYIAYGRKYTFTKDKTIFYFNNIISKGIHFLLSKFFDGHGYGSVIPTLILISFIKKNNFDVINIHNIHGYYVNITLLLNYLKKTNIKIIWTLHDSWLFTGHCSHFAHINCNKWQNSCGNCPLTTSYPSSFLDNSSKNLKLKKKLLLSFDLNRIVFVSPSSWLKNLAKSSFLNKFSIITINNGINLENFYQIKSKKNFNYYNLISVASIWTLDKGLNRLLVIDKFIKNQSLDYRLTIVGNINEKFKKEFSPLTKFIRRTKTSEELVDLFNSSSYFINPTLVDTYPSVNLESISALCPVIVFGQGGFTEAVNKSGIIFSNFNVQNLFKLLDGKKNDYEVFINESIIQRSFFDNNISFFNYYEAILNLYESN